MVFTFVLGVSLAPVGVENLLASKLTGFAKNLEPNGQRFMVSLVILYKHSSLY